MPYKDPEQRRAYHKAYSRQWEIDNKEARREAGRKSDRKRQRTKPRVKQIREVATRRHIRERVAVIQRYGGCCAFCGTTQYEHLTIDHANGDGGEHRAQIKTKYRGIADFLYRTEFRPDLYRVLCWNCHMAMTRHRVQPGGEVLHDMQWWEDASALRHRSKFGSPKTASGNLPVRARSDPDGPEAAS